MHRTRGRFVVACLAVLAAAIAVAGGGAGNRNGEASFEALAPIVNYGEYFAYGAEFKNVNTSGSVFTHVTVKQTRPVATIGNQKYPAELEKASCAVVIDTKGDSDKLNDEFTCAFGSLGPEDDAIRVTLLWKPLSVPGSPSCDSCVTSTGTWLIKEGRETNRNESWPFATSAALVGGQGIPDDKKAGGYEIAGTGAANCTAPAGNLRTNQSLTASNPVSTTVCLPLFTLPDGSIFFGYASWIVESFSQQHPSAHPELGESDVCVAALGESCGAGHIPVNWGTERARQIFRILDSAITTNPRKIEQVTHNGVPLPPCTGPKADPDFAQGCVFPIGPPSGVPKVWVVVVDAPINGPYGF